MNDEVDIHEIVELFGSVQETANAISMSRQSVYNTLNGSVLTERNKSHIRLLAVQEAKRQIARANKIIEKYDVPAN